MKHQSRKEWMQSGVVIGDDVEISRIAPDAVIYAGCRIQGAETSIGPGCVIGGEAPAVVDSCQLGRKVELKGGYFTGAVFFDGAHVGSGAHVRAGTILEEEASGAHAVGFKQTILLPFVTAGSLINFCDILMAGGTSRKNHSEVGSSYVHFNYTPHQDKATASLIGDISNGVFLDQNPIFLGGQGGLIGPARIAYGAVVAAGGVCRKDVLEKNQLHVSASLQSVTRNYESGVYRQTGRIVKNNLSYIGNLLALRAWYRQVRPRFVRDAFDQAVLDGGLSNLDLVLKERVRRLGELAGKLEHSVRQLEAGNGAANEIEIQKAFCAAWPQIKATLDDREIPPAPAALMEDLNADDQYIETIQSLDPAVREAGRVWLQSIVDRVEQTWSC